MVPATIPDSLSMEKAPTSGNVLHVSIEQLGGSLMNLTLPADSLVNDLRQLLAKTTGVPPDQQRIVHKVTMLAGHIAIASFEVNGTVHLMMIVAPPSHFVLGAYADCSARLWAVETGECHMIFGGAGGHEKQVTSAVPSPDGTLIATASSDCTAKIWDTSSGDCLHTIVGHEKPVTSIAFSPHGTLLVTASEDGIARVWRVETGGPSFVDLRSLKVWFARHANAVKSAMFTHDGASVLTAAGNVAVLWDTYGSVHKTFQRHDDLVNSAVVSSDDAFVLTACNDGRVRLFDAKTGQWLRGFLSHGSPVRCVAFSPIDSLFLAVSGERVEILTMTGTCVQSLKLDDSLRSAAFSSDGEVVVTASGNGRVNLWAVDDGEFLQGLQVSRMAVFSAVFCPQRSS